MSRDLSTTKTLWYTRCPVPTPLGIAAQLGWIEAEFDRDKIAVRTLQDEQDSKLRESHFDHWLPNSFRQGGSIPAIWARSRGRNTRLLGLTWTDESQVILTRADSDIRSVADLKGKRLGVVTRPYDPIDFWKATTVRAYVAALGTQGLTANDVELAELPAAAANTVGRHWVTEALATSREARALQTGEVDAIFHKGSRGLELAETIGARTVYDLGGHPDPKVRINNGSPRTLTVNASLVEADFPLAVRLVKKVLLASQWAEDHRAETLRYIASETNSSESAVVRAYGSDVHRHLRTDLAPASVDALADFTRFLSDWKFIPQHFDVRGWIDPRPLEQALAELRDEDRLLFQSPHTIRAA
jgi:ABC-type nitrate/sulfonate/bicarbonate transport system substrate-binding protein